MNELVAIVEGETEQTFVRDQLASHLGNRSITIWPVLPGRQRRHGGVQEWNVARQDIMRTLRESRYCTTMFDFYAMPDSWPGRVEAKALPWDKRATLVEEKMADDIAMQMGTNFNPVQFIPYIQLHEFEALAFVGINELAAVTSALCSGSEEYLRRQFQEILDGVGHPEAINDSYETCPSRQITRQVPAYRKRIHGPIVTSRIGLDRLRESCQHFAAWLSKLEKLE